MEFNLKEFTSWWENYKANRHILDEKVDAALVKARTTYLKTQILLEVD